MTPKHPLQRSYDIDDRFSEANALEAATRPVSTASLRASSWDVLKEWINLECENLAREQITAKLLREGLSRSRRTDYTAVKRVLVKRNWPAILDELIAWRRLNQHIG